MTISIPDTLTADNSGKYIMSIRLRSDGLSFSGYSPSESETFFYRNVEFDRTKPYVSSLKEFFFEHEFMTYSYRRTNLVCVTPQYTVVPEEVFTDKQKTDLLSFTFSAPENKCLHNLLTREAAEVVFGMDEEVYEFCDQSVVYPPYDSPAGFMETAEPYVDPPAIVCSAASEDDGRGLFCAGETTFCQYV